MKLEFSRKIFENTQIKFHENPSSGIQVVPCGQTAGHYEANIRGSQFCERALKNKFADYGARHCMQRLMRRQMRRIITLTHISVSR